VVHESGLILTLTGSLAAALVLGFVTHRIGLSPIVGYLLAGLIVGPYTPGFVADAATANQFAEIGIVLLMFGVGLHFHLKDLAAVRNVALIGALGQSAVATILGAILAFSFGWSWNASIVFGIALSVASTVMLTRVLVDNDMLQSPTGRIAVGWLVIEDILTVVVLVMLPPLFSPEGNAAIFPVLAFTTLKLLLLTAGIFLVGGRLIPRVLEGVTRSGSRELFTLTILVVTLGIAVSAAIFFGVSMALGAFLAGMVVGQSEFSFRAASDALPMRDAFSVLFFVSVGMLFEPRSLFRSPWLLILALGIVVIAKPAVSFAIVVLMGYGSNVAIGVAAALAQIGEFSLILGTVDDQLRLFPAGAMNVIIGCCIVSLTLNPILYRSAIRKGRAWALSSGRSTVASVAPETRFHAVIVGYGPVGRTLSRLLRDKGIESVIVDLNLDATRQAREDGHAAVLGDASQAVVLEAARIRNSVALVVSGPAADEAREIIALARRMNSGLRVLARSYYLRDSETMKRAGADVVFSGEGEVALAMTEHVLRELGATPEQIDQERQHVREEVFRVRKPD
jgi:CPA2 family monovalent cation:H+ antiporter-2